jgi:5-methylcytosine-specific restriction endonuclease McrA
MKPASNQRRRGRTLYPDNWKEIRRQVYERDEYKCQNCGARDIKVFCHHIVPIAKSGSNGLSNLVTLCEQCHNKIHPHINSRYRTYRHHKSAWNTRVF